MYLKKNGLQRISCSGALLLQQALRGNSPNIELSDVEVFEQVLIMASQQPFFLYAPPQTSTFIFFLSFKLKDLSSQQAIG
jgi:hypothetical protein